MNKIKLLSILLFTVILCAFIPNFAGAAGGAGIEPGAGCGLEGVKYDGPPFIGDLTVRLDEFGDLRANGFLERNKTGCMVELIDFPLGPLLAGEFSELKGSDYRLTCLDDGGVAGFGVCVDFSDEPMLEVIAVGAFKWLDPPANTMFTAKFIIMPLK